MTLGDGGKTEYIYERVKSRADGMVTIRKYCKLELLGRGGFASCHRVIDVENNRQLAAKVIEKAGLTKSRAKQKLMSEIKIHKSMHHENVVGFEHFFEDAKNVYLLLEVCNNRTLGEMLRRRKRLHELECQCLLRQICRGLEHVHDSKVVHRDLKLGNLFLNDQMQVKIGDFGLAAEIEYTGQHRQTLCGTPSFIAPEIIQACNEGHSYEVDIWSLGAILYTLLVGQAPFDCENIKSTYQRIKSGRYGYPEDVRLSSQVQDLIAKMLKQDPLDRPTIPEILSHPWMKSECGIPELLPKEFLWKAPNDEYLLKFIPKRLGGFYQGKLSGKDYDRLLTKRKQELVAAAPHVQRTANKAHGPRMGTRRYQTMSLRGSSIMQLSGSVQEPGGEDASDRPEDFGDLDADEEDSYKDQASYHYLDYNITQDDAMTGNLFFSKEKEAKRQLRKKLDAYTHDVCVQKWVDYSSKYGMGYILSDGQFGVNFNDGTKMLLAEDLHHIFYYWPWIKLQEYIATKKPRKEKQGKGCGKGGDLDVPLSSELLTESNLFAASDQGNDDVDDELQISETAAVKRSQNASEAQDQDGPADEEAIEERPGEERATGAANSGHQLEEGAPLNNSLGDEGMARQANSVRDGEQEQDTLIYDISYRARSSANAAKSRATIGKSGGEAKTQSVASIAKSNTSELPGQERDQGEVGVAQIGVAVEKIEKTSELEEEGSEESNAAGAEGS